MGAPHHLAAHTASFDSATLTAIAAVSDGSGGLLSLSATNFHLVDGAYRYIGAYAVMGANVIRARLTSSKTFAAVRPEVKPLERAAVPVGHRSLVHRWAAPRELVGGERYGIDAAEDAAGAARQTGLTWWTQGSMDLKPPVQCAELGAVRAAGAITANAWSNITLTLRDTLPPGIYALLGMEAEGTNLQAARAVLPTGGARPGVLGGSLQRAGAGVSDHMFRHGRMGEWGRFSSENLLTIDVLVDGANTDMEFVLDVAKVGDMPGFGPSIAASRVVV